MELIDAHSFVQLYNHEEEIIGTFCVVNSDREKMEELWVQFLEILPEGDSIEFQEFCEEFSLEIQEISIDLYQP